MTDDLTDLVSDCQRLARILIRNRAQADDLAQEALLKTWSRLAQGAEIDELRPYLMTVLRRDAARAGALPRELPLGETEVMDARANDALSRLGWQDVRTALTRLPADQAALLAAVADGLSYRQLAAREGVPIGTIMSRLARARAALRTELQLSGKDNACAELLE